MPELQALTEIANRRFEQHLRTIGRDAPIHRVEFSRRITESWALIYYRRHLVRLSPYLFLLEEEALKHGSHWRELDATLRHEAAHAAAFALCGHTGHGAAFHEAMEALGLEANGRCDLGPENAAFRYVYACPTCPATWARRTPLRGNFSCGECAPGRYASAHRLVLRESRDLRDRLRERRPLIARTLAEGRDALHAHARQQPLAARPPAAPVLAPFTPPVAALLRPREA